MATKAREFNPNQFTFEEGIERIRRASSEAKVKLGLGILTSKGSRLNKVTRG